MVDNDESRYRAEDLRRGGSQKRLYTKTLQKIMITTDVPHVQVAGGRWRTNKAQKRFEFYLKELVERYGMSEGDARCMIQDLYWDCYSELDAGGFIVELNE